MKLPLADYSTNSELQLTRLHSWAAVDRFLFYSAIIIVLAFIIGLAWGTYSSSKSTDSGITVNIGAVPTVEPLILKAVDKRLAKKTNDAFPMTTAPVPAAAAFMFVGSAGDFERAADCLASTIFYEAGNEPTAGQMAVVQVVLNRARHPAYPKTVCGVVFQGHERRTGCQFSYTCDGSMARRPTAEAWTRFRSIAQAMLKGLVYSPVGLATHYHTDWVLPAWSARLDKVRVEGTHLFFRYSGYWGSPGAYRSGPSGVEPSFAKMTALSVAHGGAETAKDPMPNALNDLIPDAQLEKVSTELSEADPSKDIFIIYVDPLLESSALVAMAKNACASRKTCKVLAWADQALMPRGLPIEPKDRASMAFSYVRQSSRESGKAKWNCALFPRENSTECL